MTTEQEKEEIKKAVIVNIYKYLAWLANAVHTQYHINDSDGFEQGDWRKCQHPVCLSILGTAHENGIDPNVIGFDQIVPADNTEVKAA